MRGYKAKRIVVHCSDSSWGDAMEIRNWHLAKGWKDIGYNAVITNGLVTFKSKYNPEADGILQIGRALDFDGYIDKDEKAAHVLGYNKDSIGICLIGNKEKGFTVKQLLTLYHFCKIFKAISPDIKIEGHYEMPTANGKTCPNIDMDKLRFIFDNSLNENFLINQIVSQLFIK